ncbi:MAG TPA: Ig-like domain-containing protein, partial [Acidimicrobiia bacterium]|nr:Ig-like domain-containing protein [Acidimicrobiia bacterium]
MRVTTSWTAAVLAWLTMLATVAVQSVATPTAVAQSDEIRLVRKFELDDLELDSPVGLAFSPVANAFHVVEAAPQQRAVPGATDIASVTPSERRLRSERIAAQLTDPINVAYDQRRGRLLSYASRSDQLIEIREAPDGALDPRTLARSGARRFGLEDHQGMAVDPTSGHLFILDGATPRLVRIEPATGGSLDGAVVAEVDLRGTGLVNPVGLALDPTTSHLHVMDPSDRTLHELKQTGEVVATRDLSGFGLVDPQGMTFAQSGDLTDDPDQMSLYLADSGLDGVTDPQLPAVSGVTPMSTAQLVDPSANGSGGATTVAAADESTDTQGSGQLLELSFSEGATLAASVVGSATSSLVQTINAWQWSPPSPDTSGVVHLPASGTLLAADGEVNEMPLYAGANMFESSLTGSLLDTFTTLDFDSDEPTGVTVNPANGHLFVSKDTSPKLVNEMDPGPDGQYATSDDVVTAVRTSDFGSNDPEGITYATGMNVLFIADGVNNEVYQYSPGPNGRFDGVAPTGDDQIVGQFDTFAVGLEDPEGVAYNPDNGSLYLAGRTPNIGTRAYDTLLEVSTSGALIRTIDVSAVNPNGQRSGQKLSGLAVGPGSQDPGAQVVYIADRGVDNDTDPNENDGRIHEMTLPSTSPVAPVAVDDSAVTVADTAVTVDVAANDSDPNGNLDPASVNSGCVFGSPGCVGASDGSLTDNGDGTITYTPAAGFSGSDGFVYEICDTDGLCSTARVDVTVSAGLDGATFMSFDVNTTVPGIGVGVRDEDIVAYDGSSGWSMYFDASDVGVTTSDLDAFHVRADGSVLMSFSSTLDVPGLVGGPAGESVEDRDVVVFTPSLTGEVTAGSFSFVFDGSDVGLDTTSEDIGGLYEFADGSWGISTSGSLNVAGVAQGGDEDVHRFTGTFGSVTSGSWALVFDGSDVGLTESSEELDGVSFLADAGLLFSTAGSYSAAGGAGDDEDVSRFVGTFGEATSGSASVELDVSTLGIDPAVDVDGLHVQTVPSSPVAPVAVDDSAVTVADTAVTVDVAANDSDPNGNLDPASVNSGCVFG